MLAAARIQVAEQILLAQEVEQLRRAAGQHPADAGRGIHARFVEAPVEALEQGDLARGQAPQEDAPGLGRDAELHRAARPQDRPERRGEPGTGGHQGEASSAGARGREGSASEISHSHRGGPGGRPQAR